MKTIRSRVLLVVVLAAGSVFSLLPRWVTERTYDSDTGQMVETTVRRVPIHLGLDLRGGSHLALEIDESKARVADCAEAIRRAERVIRNRVSEFGTTEPVIQVAGACRLIVELPGERDPVRARSVVQRTAFLEFRLVDRRDRFNELAPALEDALGMPGSVVRGQLPGEYLVADRHAGQVQRALETTDVRRVLPRSVDVRWSTDIRVLQGVSYRPFYVLESRALVTGAQLVRAIAARDPMTSPTAGPRDELRHHGRDAVIDLRGASGAVVAAHTRHSHRGGEVITERWPPSHAERPAPPPYRAARSLSAPRRAASDRR